ncbi:hypothetical protein PALU110988_27295 [Paenibacillus lupini]|uniref:hypothetical protein n=1 Tax=Paenibacillus lupini TaxID=1450204 RepID=UPI00141F999D|nr:hypothetical protein [Paenibacillus lupini]NIK24189.1 hypothetical protein [Paenibacillus lupini]
MEPIEYEFLLEDMFDLNKSLSRFIIKLAMARNDVLYVHKHLLKLTEQQPNNYVSESFYFFKLGISHLREAYMLLDAFKNDNTVKSFIEQTGPENQEMYSRIKEVNKNYNSNIVGKLIKPIRHNTFHYYKTGKDFKEFDMSFMQELLKLKGLETGIRFTGEKVADAEYTFADEISFNLQFKTYDGSFNDNEMKRILGDLSELMTDFLSFSDYTVAYYLTENESKMRNLRK